MNILDIPVDQVKRMALETIVLLLMDGKDASEVDHLGLGMDVNGVYVRINVGDRWAPKP